MVSTTMWTGSLIVGRVGPVVTDVRVCEGDDLSGVGRVGDHLLVSAEHRVEHDLAGCDLDLYRHFADAQ